MARLQLAEGSVSRLVDLWRDNDPLPGEGWPKRIDAEHYGSFRPQMVAKLPIVQTAKWSRFLIEKGPVGDALLKALKAGPVKVKPSGPSGGYKVDLDRIERP